VKPENPSQEMLAMIAAQILGLCDGDSTIAARKAADLWDACGSEIGRRTQFGDPSVAREFAQNAVKIMFESDPPKDVPQPKHWPATLKNFYILVVGGKNAAQRESRFKKFLISQIEFERRAKTFQHRAIAIAQGKDTKSPESQINAQRTDANGTLETRLEHYRNFQFDPRSWTTLAYQYLAWWQKHLTQTKRQAGREGGNSTLKSPRRRRRGQKRKVRI
jgi:hypothetical protein